MEMIALAALYDVTAFVEPRARLVQARQQSARKHGPLGLMPLAAHGHADALAIWLTIDGEA